MAAPIEFGLILKGKDLQDFDDYIRNPTCTKEGLALLREAEELAISWE